MVNSISKKTFLALIFLSIISVGFSFAQENKLSPELNIFNWEDYIDSAATEGFEKKFGVKVNMFNFENEDEMIAGVESDPARYDLAIISGDQVKDLIRMKLVAKIDYKNIPNIKNINPKFLNPNYDRDNTYSVPYLWGTTGIVINKKYITGSKSWQILFDPKYKGKIAMLNGYNEVLGSTLKSLKYSYNTKTRLELEEAKSKMFSQKEIVAGYFDSITLREKMINEDLWAAQIYSGEGIGASKKNPSVEYFIPEEGAVVWVDNFIVPRDSENKYTAEIFINYMLDPKISAETANYEWYANCNLAAEKYMSAEVLNDKTIYPDEEVMGRCEFPALSDISKEDPAVLQFWNKAISDLQLYP